MNTSTLRLPTTNSFLPAQVNHVVFSQAQIKERVEAIGQQITEDYSDKELIIFGVLKGVLFFQADLLRAIDLPVKSDVMAIAGYKAGEKRPPGMVRIIKDLDLDVYGRHVLI